MENSIDSYIEKASFEELERIEKLISDKKKELKISFLEEHPYIEGVKIRYRKTYHIKNGKKYYSQRFECTIKKKIVYLGVSPNLEKFKQKIIDAKKST